MSSIFERTKRDAVAGTDWWITVQLRRGDSVIEESAAPLVLADSWFNKNFGDAGKNIASWIDDLAAKRSRNETAAKRAAKR